MEREYFIENEWGTEDAYQKRQEKIIHRNNKPFPVWDKEGV